MILMSNYRLNSNPPAVFSSSQTATDALPTNQEKAEAHG